MYNYIAILTWSSLAVSMPLTNTIRPKSRAMQRFQCTKLCFPLNAVFLKEQVDILISKTRRCKYYSLNIMYTKLMKIIMDKKLMKSTKIWSPSNEQTYPTLQTVTTQYNKNIPYNWSAFIAVNNVFTSYMQ